jgi:ATP-binding cassette subfamily B protein
VPLLRALGPDLLRSLAKRLSVERHAAGDVIIRRGETGDRLYIIERGTVEVFAANPAPGQRPLAVLREGDHFGEIALLYDTPRTATIRARTPVQLYSLQKEDFDTLLSRVPELRRLLEQSIGERARMSAVAHRPSGNS